MHHITHKLCNITVYIVNYVVSYASSPSAPVCARRSGRFFEPQTCGEWGSRDTANKQAFFFCTTGRLLLYGGENMLVSRCRFVPREELLRRGFNDVAISSVRWHASGSLGAYVVALPCGTASAYSWQNKSKFTSLLFLFLRLPFSLPLRLRLGRMVLRQ